MSAFAEQTPSQRVSETLNKLLAPLRDAQTKASLVVSGLTTSESGELSSINMMAP
jgi:hypothetical protein